MTPEFAEALKAKMDAFLSWSSHRPAADGRLVKYEGVLFVGAMDVPFDELSEEVEGLFCEGYALDWSEHLGRIYLVAWEATDPVVPWELIYQEKDLVDIKVLMAAEQNGQE
ncbi:MULTISPECIES: hypothetical protein [unclassified Acidovorax]|nr:MULTISPECIES: hypothetical protein [unclassified Acidovorax]